MNIIVFSGPTLSTTNIKRIINADCRPPAKQGDIYLATYDQPNVIVLIDGYFESVPAVWHKEILYALSLGIKVYGCSSMGALRAAELAHFGMQGSGRVFESYINSVWEDDDEVALVHGPAELGYPHVSIPMVNIRATLEHAIESHIINQQESALIIEALKQLHYPKRTLSKLYEYALELFGDDRAQSLRRLTENNYIDIKNVMLLLF
ncbi:TfuA-like protein [Vibrio splendidus]